MKYITILKMALTLFKHTIKHLSTQDIKYGDEIYVDINWTIQRKENEKT